MTAAVLAPTHPRPDDTTKVSFRKGMVFLPGCFLNGYVVSVGVMTIQRSVAPTNAGINERSLMSNGGIIRGPFVQRTTR